MLRLVKRASRKVGQPPGTLIHVGEKKTEKVKISVIEYDQARFRERTAATVEECFPFKEKPTVTWINIDGIHQVEIIEGAGKHLDIHPLVLEDILNTEQRPKTEVFEKYLFLVLKTLGYDKGENEITGEQIGLILGPDFVVSFQERESGIFDPVKERIRNAKGRIRKMGPDYLAYALVDATVDNYFLTLEKIGEKIEDLEEDLVSNPRPETLQQIHRLKRNMILLRKSVWPLREVINGLLRTDSPLIMESIQTYVRDVYDHTIQVIDTVESYRDIITGMLDTYLSSVSNKMNEIMKVLTIIATIFIPLTFIAGIYGMNFRFMPELEWPWAYFAVLVIMVVVGIGMLIYFRRKKWL